ncbi:type II secretion system protein [Campylobacter sp.]|uniref:type II secretion system protein n=1 Tax=Campylobacter sp. TaxID=205 RepID=UPI002A56E656|nr:type II secretion system protein [Campylobacter sp.]MDD7090850.1 type II secretion system protein [Campylobacteraceae bacterium]MDY5285154.1 type II secretion system protein [Campylobacter sp.]
MKKGFTMIELIFVIVILGILASVAIPRLAATREDAEISAAVANLRTLVSDVTAYYTAKGEFGNNTKWSEITNVPLGGATTNAINTGAKLKVGGKDCIGVQLQNKTTGDATAAKAAHIIFTKETNGVTNGTVCKQVQDSEPLKSYFASTIKNDNATGKMAIGSSTSVYGSK